MRPFIFLTIAVSLFASADSFAESCTLRIRNYSTENVKVTVAGVTDKEYLEAKSEKVLSYSNGSISKDDSYKVPVTVLDSSYAIVRAFQVRGGSIGQELVPSSFFREAGGRTMLMKLKRNNAELRVKVSVNCAYQKAEQHEEASDEAGEHDPDFVSAV
jgi:hypothetical protein